MWLKAIFDILLHDLQEFWTIFRLPLLGAVLGTSVGSLFRWYWARYQLGLAAGMCCGLQVDLLFSDRGGHGRVLSWYPLTRWFLNDDDLSLAIFGTAAVAALLVSLVSEPVLQYFPSILAARFRDGPFHWLTLRATNRIAIGSLLGMLVIWSIARGNQVANCEERLRLESRLPELAAQWNPYGISVNLETGYRHGGYWLTIESRDALRDSPVLLYESCPKPLIIAVKCHDVIDNDIRQSAAKLSQAEILHLRCREVTDEGLLFLADFTELKQLFLVNCRSISKVGIEQFHDRRPNVPMRVELDYDWFEIPAASP